MLYLPHLANLATWLEMRLFTHSLTQTCMHVMFSGSPQLGGGVGEQAARHVGVGFAQQLVISICLQRQPLQHSQRAQNQRIVGRHPEREAEENAAQAVHDRLRQGTIIA